jgi:hypothetical protein
MTVLQHHEKLARAVRTGTLADLAVGTWRKLITAIDAGRSSDVADYADFFVVEARVCYDLYTQWRADALRYLRDKGLDPAQLAAETARIGALVHDGRPPIVADRDAAWTAVQRLRTAVVEAAADPAVARGHAVALHEIWRHLHDAEIDFLSGLFDLVVRRFGEAALGEMYQGWLIGDWFDKRYSLFDVRRLPWDQAFPLIVYLTFESMHGHLSGPGREGTIAFEEFEDRIVFSFDPCGSGGRTLRGEPLDGTGPLMEPPLRFKALEQAHDFTGGKAGVCTYCAHCCVLTEKLPIERFGYPVRVVDPPLWPASRNSPCRWTVYRDPRLVPDEIYARVGSRKPPADAPLGSAE